MADYRLLPHSEEDESEGEMGDIDEDENIDSQKKRTRIKGQGVKSCDPVLNVIGEFGPYQAWLCFVGFLMNMVHAWLSLSLKFVGMKTKFVCLESGDEDSSDQEETDQCNVISGITTKPCTAWTYDETEFKGSIVERWNLVCDKEGGANFAQSVFFAGCLVGVFVAGQASDRFGRKPITIALLLVFIASACAGGIVTSWPVWLSLRFVVGAASIGMVTVRYTIQVEMIGSSWRSYANTATSCGWVAGYITLPLLAYIMQDMHQLEIVIGLSMFPILLLIVFCHPESPKWLLTVGKLKKAAAVLNRAAAWNHLPAAPSLSSTSIESSTNPSSSSSLLTLLSFPRQLRCLVLMCLCWLSFGMAYFGIALHTPEFGSNVFLVFFIGGVMDLPVLLLTPCLLNSLGRRRCLTGGLAFGAACLILSSIFPSGYFYKEWPVITLVILGKVGVGLAFDTGYVWTSELFPTAVRNSALSTCSSFARLGAFVAPLLANLGDSARLPMAVYGLVSGLAALLSLGLGPETMGVTTLPDTLEEGEDWGLEKRWKRKQRDWTWSDKVTPE